MSSNGSQSSDGKSLPTCPAAALCACVLWLAAGATFGACGSDVASGDGTSGIGSDADDLNSFPTFDGGDIGTLADAGDGGEQSDAGDGGGTTGGGDSTDSVDSPDIQDGMDAMDAPLPRDGDATDANDASDATDAELPPPDVAPDTPDTLDTPDLGPDLPPDTGSEVTADTSPEVAEDTGPDTIEPPSVYIRVPEGALAFSGGNACPADWERQDEANGYLLKGVTQGAQVGVTVGVPLGPAETRMHTHDFTFDIDPPNDGVAGLSSCCNTNPAYGGVSSQSGTTNAWQSLLPTKHQMLCTRQAPGDPQAPIAHPFPEGTILHFDALDCPAGWTVVEELFGRFLVPTATGGSAGDFVGTALANGAEATHGHSFSGSINISQHSLIGLGGGNNDVAAKGNAGFSVVTDAESTDLPYIQYLVCRAAAQPGPPTDVNIVADTIPSGTVAFFWDTVCPAGWSESADHKGRFMVAMPDGGSEHTDNTALSPLEDREHTHGVDSSVTIPSQEIALGSGCCHNNSGGNGTYNYSLTTESSSSNMPYFSLLACTAD